MGKAWIVIVAMAAIFGNSMFGVPGQTVFAYEDKVAEISDYLSGEILKSTKKIVAVVDFTDLRGNVTELGRFFAREISTSLAMGSKGFEVVDRIHLNSILAEHQLAEKGIINPNTARQLGKIAGVEILVTGTITPLGDNIRLNTMVLDIETAKIIAASKENILMTETLATLLGSEITTDLSSSGNSKKSSESKDKSAEGELEYFGFTVKPLSCEMKGSKLVCPVTFTNAKSEQRKVSISNSIFYDEFGNVYQHRDTAVSVGERAGSYINYNFMPQVPVKIDFIVRDFKSDASAVTVSIDIKEAGSRTSSTYTIKGIPIIK